jgi:predicted glycogen debranching enzyme
MTSYEGLLLLTGRQDEGRGLLRRSATTLSQGMLANTADTGATEFNTADATLWFLHAVDRHVTATGDVDLASELIAGLEDVIRWHVAGTRYGIRADPVDGLLTQGQDGVALTWMDARVDGTPVTPRAGKAVEINALWINGLAAVAGLQERLRRDATSTRALEAMARTSFDKAFRTDEGVLLDVIGDNGQIRPNQLLAVSLPHAPLSDPSIVQSCARPLLTSLGLRSLAPSDPGYVGRHRGSPAARDGAYHQGTVWPWLIGPYVEAAMRTGSTASSLAGGPMRPPRRPPGAAGNRRRPTR